MTKKTGRTDVAKAVDTLAFALKQDKDYWNSWQANIAMAYYDAERWYKAAHGNKYLNHIDKHKIANDAAQNFLTNLSKRAKP